jgi:hypothetical protein
MERNTSPSCSIAITQSRFPAAGLGVNARFDSRCMRAPCQGRTLTIFCAPEARH